MWSSFLVLSLLTAQPPAPEPADWSFRLGLVTLAAVTASDLETTGRALERGLQERNPILKPFADSYGLAGLVSGAISGGVALGAYQLHRKGKRTEARIVVWTWAAIRAAVVVHNVRQLRHAR